MVEMGVSELSKRNTNPAAWKKINMETASSQHPQEGYIPFLLEQ